MAANIEFLFHDTKLYKYLLSYYLIL